MGWSVTRKLLREEGSQLYLFDVQPNLRPTPKPAVSDDEIYRIAANHAKSPAQLLTEINWDFKDSVTQYLTHKFHSYPARFIPQIPCTAVKICLAASNRFRMLSQYLADMLKSMSEICRVLKPGKYAWIVIGNSSVEHVIIDNHIFFAMMGEFVGMPLQAQTLRNINKGKKYTSKNIGNIDDEYVMLFQKKDYIPPKPDLIEKMVCAVLSDLREQLISDTLPYDEKVLASSVKRFFKRKNLSLREAKGIYRERNIEKLNKAIRNILCYH